MAANLSSSIDSEFLDLARGRRENISDAPVYTLDSLNLLDRYGFRG